MGGGLFTPGLCRAASYIHCTKINRKAEIGKYEAD